MTSYCGKCAFRLPRRRWGHLVTTLLCDFDRRVPSFRILVQYPTSILFEDDRKLVGDDIGVLK